MKNKVAFKKVGLYGNGRRGGGLAVKARGEENSIVGIVCYFLILSFVLHFFLFDFSELEAFGVNLLK